MGVQREREIAVEKTGSTLPPSVSKNDGPEGDGATGRKLWQKP